MRKVTFLLILTGLALVLFSAWSFAASCSASLNCPCGNPSYISCYISTNEPGHSVSCWAGPGDQITCCEFNEYGNPIRDIHKGCISCGGGGGPGGGPIEA